MFLPSKRLLCAFYNTPLLLRTLLRTSVSIETLTRRLLRTLLRSASFKEPSKNPSKSRVRLHDPLSVHLKFLLVSYDLLGDSCRLKSRIVQK